MSQNVIRSHITSPGHIKRSVLFTS